MSLLLPLVPAVVDPDRLQTVRRVPVVALVLVPAARARFALLRRDGSARGRRPGGRRRGSPLADAGRHGVARRAPDQLAPARRRIARHGALPGLRTARTRRRLVPERHDGARVHDAGGARRPDGKEPAGRPAPDPRRPSGEPLHAARRALRVECRRACDATLPLAVLPRRAREHVPRVDRYRGLLYDTGVAYLYRVLPRELRRSSRRSAIAGVASARAPGRASGCSARSTSRTSTSRSRGRITSPERSSRTFLAGIEQGDELARTLHFAHLKLPHAPFRPLPSGREYGHAATIDGILDDAFNDWTLVPVARGPSVATSPSPTRLHRPADGLARAATRAGRSLRRRARHRRRGSRGELRRGGSRRYVTAENVADIASVPLFVKYPGRTEGRVDSRRANTTDIVPTVADVVGIDLPWHVDGRSLLATHRSPGDVSVGKRDGRGARRLRGVRRRGRAGDCEAKRSPLRRGPRLALSHRPSSERLIGRAVDGANDASGGGVRARLDGETLLADVRLASGFVPARIVGSLDGRAAVPGASSRDRAQRADRRHDRGRIVQDGHVRFATLVPETAFRNGDRTTSTSSASSRRPGSLRLARLGGTSRGAGYALSARRAEHPPSERRTRSDRQGATRRTRGVAPRSRARPCESGAGQPMSRTRLASHVSSSSREVAFCSHPRRRSIGGTWASPRCRGSSASGSSRSCPAHEVRGAERPRRRRSGKRRVRARMARPTTAQLLGGAVRMTLALPPLRWRATHLAALWAFGVAQPVFSMLQGNPEFLVVRGSTRTDVVVFALLLAFGLPLAGRRRAGAHVPGRPRHSPARFTSPLSGARRPRRAPASETARSGNGYALLLPLVPATLLVVVYLRSQQFRSVLSLVGGAAGGRRRVLRAHRPACRRRSSGREDRGRHAHPRRSRRLRRASRELVATRERDDRRHSISELCATCARRNVVPTRDRRPTPRRRRRCRPSSPADCLAAVTSRRSRSIPRTSSPCSASGTRFALTSRSPGSVPPGTALRSRGRVAFGDRQRGLFYDTSVGYLHRILPRSIRAHCHRSGSAGADSVKARTSTRASSSSARSTRRRGTGTRRGTRSRERTVRGVPPHGARNGSCTDAHVEHALFPHTPWYFLPSGKRYGGTLLNGIEKSWTRWRSSRASRRSGSAATQAPGRLHGSPARAASCVGSNARVSTTARSSSSPPITARASSLGGISETSSGRTSATSRRCRCSSSIPANAAVGSTPVTRRRSTSCRRSRTSSACVFHGTSTDRPLRGPALRRPVDLGTFRSGTVRVDYDVVERGVLATARRNAALLGEGRDSLYRVGPSQRCSRTPGRLVLRSRPVPQARPASRTPICLDDVRRLVGFRSGARRREDRSRLGASRSLRSPSP